MIFNESFELEDKVREKALAVRVSGPRDQADCPVIVFSHGLLGSKDGYQPLVEHWASHGYIVIQPTHYDSAAHRKPTLTELRDLTPLFVGWESRPDDIIFILDSLTEIEKHVAHFGSTFDRSRIGMGGHSFGSHTAMLLGGTKLASGSFGDCGNQNRGNNGTQFSDDRIKAFLLLSPQGSGRALTETADFDQSAWDDFDRPMMIITGTEDNGRRKQTYLWRSEAYHLAPPGDKYLVVIDGGYHGFGGITGTRFFGSGPANPLHVEWMLTITLAFFDRYIKGDAAVTTILTEEHLAKISTGALALSKR
jgi:predicted dienelactone hydrolase